MLLVSGVNCLAAGLSLLGLCICCCCTPPFSNPGQRRTSLSAAALQGHSSPRGAAAATGHVGLGGWWLFALVMVWTPAHFWALALLLREDYRAVGIPMLPVVKGPVVTARAIRRYGWATVLLTGSVFWPCLRGVLRNDAASLQWPFDSDGPAPVDGSRQPDGCQGTVSMVDFSIYSASVCC